MRLLCEIRDSDVFPGTKNHNSSQFAEKETSRIVFFNDLGHIALLHVGKYHYHKLPGGGIESGEDPRRALDRELLEELGRRAQIIAEIGMIVEHKNEQQRRQTSYCYLGKQVGETAAPHFTVNEQAHQYTEVWMPNIDSAIDLVRQDEPVGYSRKFIQVRELAFLRTAKKIIEAR